MALLTQEPVSAECLALHFRLQKTFGALLMREGYRVTEAPQVMQATVIFPVIKMMLSPRKQRSKINHRKEIKVALRPIKPSKQKRNDRKNNPQPQGQ